MAVQFQHYVPQFYLSGWQTEIYKKPRSIWIYERGQKPRPSSIKKAGGEDNYYAISNYDGTTDIETIENLLGKGESRAGLVFSKLKEQISPSEKERKDFAEFLTDLVRRGPFQRTKAPQLIDKFLSKIIDPLLERAKSIQDKTGRAKAIANIEKVQLDIRENPERVIAKTLEQPSDVSLFIEGMDWAYFINKKENFVTSDNPFVYSVGLGIAEKENGHIILPISNEMSFQAGNSTNFQNTFQFISNEDSKAINLRIIGHAVKEVYSNKLSDELDELVQKNLGKDLQL